MNNQLKLLLIFLLPVASYQALFEENKYDGNKESYNDDRFLKDLDDDEWHIAHLKHAQFDGRRSCLGDTFEDRAQRYRKTLQNDAALVKFVSADPIPANESEIIEGNCKVDEVLDKNNTKKEPVSEKSDLKQVTNAGTGRDVNAKETAQTSDYVATTATMKMDEEDKRKGKNEKNKDVKSRKASEYMFSSVEYYDDVPDFDRSVCPDAVDVIELEIDEIRSYDLECEKVIEWRSLID